MATWAVHHGDIYEVQAEVLVCSANVFLTLSGGVGGELLRRYGASMQEPLDTHLKGLGKRHVQAGEVISVSGEGTPYRLILHAVAVDGMYESSPELVSQVVDQCLKVAAEHGAASVVLPALATGYGHLTVEQFSSGLSELHQRDYPPVGLVTVALRDKVDSDKVSRRLCV